MDFNYTQEQQQLADSLRRWLSENYDINQRNDIIQSKTGVSEEVWTALTNLGILALPLPESCNGFNGNLVDMFVVFEELGRGLCVEPYFSTVLGAMFLKEAGAEDDLLTDVGSGKVKLACALQERHSRYELSNISVHATEDDANFVVNGRKTIVRHGAQADYLIVSARTSGAISDSQGISLFLIPNRTPGIVVREYRTIDGQRAADIDFNHLVVPTSSLIGAVGDGWRLLEQVADYGAIFSCAEAIGAMEALNDSTLDYLKTRRQFNVPIGDFQVLQHRMVDMVIHLSQARAISTLAALKFSEAMSDEERRYLASAAKARVGRAMRFISQNSIQLHGGIGLMDELPVSHYVKKVLAIEANFGNTDFHLTRFIRQPAFRETKSL